MTGFGLYSIDANRLHRYLREPPWLHPTEATLVARASHPLDKRALTRRTSNSRMTEEAILLVDRGS